MCKVCSIFELKNRWLQLIQSIHKTQNYSQVTTQNKKVHQNSLHRTHKFKIVAFTKQIIEIQYNTRVK